jgi:hypothetical protein
MFEKTIIVCFGLLTIAAMLAAGWALSQAITLSWKVHEQSALIARSQQESATKYVTAVAQTANLISEKIDARVAARVKTINTLMRGKTEEEVEPIEEQPPPDAPGLFQSGFVNELSEITREMTRHRRDDEEYPAREMGIGAEEV